MSIKLFLYVSFFLLFAICVLFSFSSNAQSNGWFTAKKIAEKTWVIDEHGIDNIFLLEGRDSALLIDAGFGLANLKEFVKSLTSKPLILVNTHGHPDHAGGDYQFQKAFIGYGDTGLVKFYTEPKMMKQIVKLFNITIPDSLKSTDTVNLVPTIFLPLNDKDVFNLGGRNVQVIATPGHTVGSICLLDATTKFLFTGDNIISKEVWLFLKESIPVQVYKTGLKKIINLKSKFTNIFPAHGSPMLIEGVNEILTCTDLILTGKCNAKPYKSFAGEGMSCTYKSVTIDFDPVKVKKSK